MKKILTLGTGPKVNFVDDPKEAIVYIKKVVG